ncbi:NusG domain II-containing protein [Clostridium aminobutyricum]|uniref:NusG domain II-containing protein n=1 Tax=Clostridium aminobutyricum TaxID=33953 RepID=A0A939D815_CLOAM|nr:NusG domain II-containing protein [Clostridium aminobutyricum]MBN7773199.1 NusG domain II-containing protein [Clostridium aminobutyricum]
MIKKADIILAIVFIILGLCASYVAGFGSHQGSTVLITVDGKEYGSYALNKNKTVTVKNGIHTNVVVIKNGSVSMDSSDCKNQICVHAGAISNSSQSIICLPNRVVVQIEGKESEYDAISN